MERLNVVFRIEADGDVLAVFPSIPADYCGSMLCYAHIGQHGACSPSHYYRNTKPATPDQYAALLAELRGIYEKGEDAVQLVPCKRMSQRDLVAFAAETCRLANA